MKCMFTQNECVCWYTSCNFYKIEDTLLNTDNQVEDITNPISDT